MADRLPEHFGLGTRRIKRVGWLSLLGRTLWSDGYLSEMIFKFRTVKIKDTIYLSLYPLGNGPGRKNSACGSLEQAPGYTRPITNGE